MALNRKDCHRKERFKTKGGTYYYKYFYKCIECAAEISSQHSYLKKHSGKCISCVQKGKPYITAYNQMLGNYTKRGIEVNITYEEFYKLCKILNCHYCYKPIHRTLKRGSKGYRGYFLDRKDNDAAYTVANCVPCCWSCNQIKGNRFTYEQFLKIAEVIRSFQ